MNLTSGQIDIIKYLKTKPNGATLGDMVNDISSAQYIGNNSKHYLYERLSRMIKKNLVVKINRGIYGLGDAGEKYLLDI